MLRQQSAYGDSRPNRSLADYVAPEDDHIGGFAVAIHGADELAAALRGRARRLPRDHGQGARRPVRRGLRRVPARAGAGGSGTRPGPSSPSEDLIAERFRGIRPAFGYPACPDHTEKRTLFGLLPVAEVGVELTETCAMLPASAVSGIYLAHPQARYFSVGRIGRDQVEDYAARKGIPLEEAERWLRPEPRVRPARQRQPRPQSELSSSGGAREGVCRILP